jgi:predicted Zn-dependent peptidase
MSTRYFRDVLPSGLRVVTVEAPHLHSALLAVYVRTGSRHETPETNGVSHFLEHLFFRGSESYPDTVRMNGAVEELGGNLNGVTTRDHGYYYTPLHPEHVDVGLRIIGDLLTRPKLSDLEIERKIILEEMLDEVDEKGRDIDIDNLSMGTLFPGHPLGMKIAGSKESVQALTLEQIRTHFARHYVAGNLVVVATGQVERAQVLEQVGTFFAALPKGPQTKETRPRPHQGPLFAFTHHEDSQAEFRLSFRTVPEEHLDFPALALLRRVLDDGLSSRLPYEIVEKRGLAYSLSVSLDSYQDLGLFEVDAACLPANAAKVADLTFEVLAGLCDRLVPDEELARVKRRHRMLLEFSQDSTGDLAAWYGGTELFRRPEDLEERIRQTEAQTARDLQRAARRVFKRSNLVGVAVGPRRGAKALERAITQARALR